MRGGSSPYLFSKLIVALWDKSPKGETWKKILQGNARRASLGAHFNQQRFGNALVVKYVSLLKSVPKFKYTIVKMQRVAEFPPLKKQRSRSADTLTAAVPAVPELSSLSLRRPVLVSVLSLCSDICIHPGSYSSFCHLHHNNTQRTAKTLWFHVACYNRIC